MNKKIAIVALLALTGMTGPTFAASKDDTAWVNKCIADNKGEGAKASVVKAYCECMNNEMSDNETLSISAWEKKNPKTQAMCSKKAGWK